MRTKRDWKAYNEHLVQRGEIFLNVDCLEGWGDELRQLNQDKEGRRFEYPDSLILFLATLKVAFDLGYREAEGLARSVSKFTDNPVPTYSTVNRRLKKLELDLSQLPPQGEPITLAVDASGLQVVHRKGWMRKKRKGFVKIHIAIEIKSKKVLALEITDDQIHESAKFQELVTTSTKQADVEKALADGGYDSGDCFEWLAKHEIKAGILPRKNARPGSSGARSEVVTACQQNRSQWKKDIGYGQRNLVESAFSSFKSMFGKRLYSHNWEQMQQEVKLKINTYNLLVGLSTAR
jgi:IS5 family transposase